MGGRGNLGSKHFKHTTKGEVLQAFKRRNIVLMKDSKVINDPNMITNKELATLSALSEVEDLKYVKFVDITNRMSEKPIVAVNLNVKKGNGEVAKVPTVLVSKSLSSKGFNYMNKIMGEKGVRGFTIKKKPSKKKPVNRVTRNSSEADQVKEFLKSLGLD